ncbi:MAG TPA: lysophospholipid acyltransferase family protein [Steroidobacteraceae bacterium]|nr:lysophospholipid acyltransferase family protein [Steroidobacteraceae bacterium]
MTPQDPLQLRAERAARRALFRACRTGVRHLSFRQVHWLGTLLGELQFRVAYPSRRRMVHDLAAVLDTPDERRTAGDILRQAFRVNNAAVLETLKILDAQQDTRALIARVEVTGVSILRDAIAAGRGALLLGTHMGNSALLMIRLVESGIPLSIVHREAPMMEPGFFEHGISRYGIEPILANRAADAFRSILSALRRNRVIYISIDQGVKKSQDGLLLRFLGKDMPIAAGPAHIARRSRAPVLPVATLAANPTWRFEILPPMQQCDASVAEDLKAMLRISEQLILRNPHLWSWHHRRWRDFPLATNPDRRE